MSDTDGQSSESAPESFRDRLARIPDADTRPNEDWERAAPPVIGQPAPVARPAPSPRPTYESHAPEASSAHYGAQGYVTDSSPAQPNDFVPIGPRRRRRWPFIVGLLLVVLALIVLIPLLLVRRTFNDIDRVQVSQALSDPIPEGRNILLVGTDSRAGIDESTENAGVILGEGIAGERTDTIMVLRIEEGGSKFLSLPRDLWLPINGGGEQRINTAIAQGPDALVNTVQDSLGIPISHYVQVDLAGFIDLVDAVGGVEITIENPAFDRRSGLDLPEAGTVTLDSAQALAWVRSRTFTEVIDGQNVVDGTSDLGRVARQQVFMRALLEKLLDQRNPTIINEMLGSVGASLVLDDATTLTDAFNIGTSLRDGLPESVVLPTTPDSRGGNSVLVLAPGSQEVLRTFGAP